MDLTFIQDYTTNTILDDELMGVPDSGVYWNQDVHPLVNLKNILAFLPVDDFTIELYDETETYNKWSTNHLSHDIVEYNDVIYQSLSDSNIGNTPAEDSEFWLVTNIESIRLKIFLEGCKRNAISALSLNRKIIENQMLYNVGKTVKTLDGDYSGWCLEPRGSDYVAIRINKIALQATSSGDVSLYVVNQGEIVDTLTLTANGGKLVWESLNYIITGVGRFYLLFDSQEVKSNGAYNDPLKFKSFVAYPVQGNGDSPEEAELGITSASNGLNFNITTYLDADSYIDDNIYDLSAMIKMQFEYDCMRMFLTNSNAVSEGTERNITDNERTMRLLGSETLDTQSFTVAQKYKSILKETKDSINNTFDRFLKVKSKFTVRSRTIG